MAESALYNVSEFVGYKDKLWPITMIIKIQGGNRATFEDVGSSYACLTHKHELVKVHVDVFAESCND